MHCHDHRDVGFDRADDPSNVERGKCRDDLDGCLLRASSPREAVSELRQNIKAQVCGRGTHPTSVLSRRRSVDNGMVAFRQRIAISVESLLAVCDGLTCNSGK